MIHTTQSTTYEGISHEIDDLILDVDDLEGIMQQLYAIELGLAGYPGYFIVG